MLRQRRQPTPPLLAIVIVIVGLVGAGCGVEPSGIAAQDTSVDADVGATPASPFAEGPDPGLTLRRLTAAQYDNAVRDLFSTTLRPGAGFPTDVIGGGFDHLAAHASVSPLLVESWAAAARAVAADVLEEHEPSPVVTRVEAESATSTAAFPVPGFGVALWNPAPLVVAHHVPAEGTWTLAARVYVASAYDNPEPTPETLQWRVDGAAVAELSVSATAAAPEVLTVDVALTEGIHAISVQRLGPEWETEGAGGSASMIAVDWLEVRSPPELWPAVADTRSSVLICDPGPEDASTCAAEAVEAVAARAWRRPVTELEVDALADLVLDAVVGGEGFEAGLAVAIEAVLLSPNFLFVVERGGVGADGVGWLTNHEVATRLALFLWSSVPDAALRAAADTGELGEPGGIEAQVRRMLDDPRAAALRAGLVDQWLLLRAFDDASPDVDMFPEVDPALRLAMRAETEAFFDSFFGPTRGFDELLAGEEVWVEARLASHYGLEGVDGAVPAAVGEHGLPRAGLLGHASLLTALSHPRRTSPTRRGKWVLEALLCETIEPPPPGAADGVAPDTEGASLIEALLAHSVDPACAGCHAAMDPIGFGLEAFDAVGAWRGSYSDGSLVVTEGQLPDGEGFSGAVDLSLLLADDPRFPACVVQKLVTYALGREPRPEEHPALDALVAQAADAGNNLPELIVSIATSELFRTRLVHPPPAPREVAR